jgi:hypothetical protein
VCETQRAIRIQPEIASLPITPLPTLCASSIHPSKRRPLFPSHSAKAKNREHAKNTRIRKKHYIEALKESLKLLFDERDKIDKDRRSSLSRLAEQANVRKQVLQTMFFYRASAETSLKRWGSILDDNFQLVLPITPYRSFPPAEVITHHTTF